MSKLKTLGTLKGKELFAYIIANKQALITEKKSLPVKYSDTFIYSPTVIKVATTKSDSTVLEEGKVHVTVVANTMNWCDSQMDVLLTDCCKKTIKERKNVIPHIHDHVHSVESKIGEVTDIYLKDMNLTELGISQVGFTQALIFETDIYKSYNEKVYNQYKLNKINQHSIGLKYVKIDIAINDSEYEKEQDYWNKYYPLVINKDKVDKEGYFWVVSEIMLLENSCVLFGANEITPTLEVKGTEIQPGHSTVKQPQRIDVLSAIGKAVFID